MIQKEKKNTFLENTSMKTVSVVSVLIVLTGCIFFAAQVKLDVEYLKDNFDKMNERVALIEVNIQQTQLLYVRIEEKLDRIESLSTENRIDIKEIKETVR